MKRKRIADWLEKMSAAFFAGTVLAQNGSLLTFIFGAACFWLSLRLTDGGENDAEHFRPLGCRHILCMCRPCCFVRRQTRLAEIKGTFYKGPPSGGPFFWLGMTEPPVKKAAKIKATPSWGGQELKLTLTELWVDISN